MDSPGGSKGQWVLVEAWISLDPKLEVQWVQRDWKGEEIMRSESLPWPDDDLLTDISPD